MTIDQLGRVKPGDTLYFTRYVVAVLSVPNRAPVKKIIFARTADGSTGTMVEADDGAWLDPGSVHLDPRAAAKAYGESVRRLIDRLNKSVARAGKIAEKEARTRVDQTKKKS